MAKQEWAGQETQEHSGLQILCKPNSTLANIRSPLTLAQDNPSLLRGLSRVDSHGTGGQSLFFTYWPKKKKSTSKQGHLTLAGASSHVIVLRRAGWGSHTEWRPTGKMCHFPPGAHIAHGWEGEIPRGGVGRSSSWLPRRPSVKMFKIMRHLCTGAKATFLQGRE